MKRKSATQHPAAAFERVKQIGLALSNVEASTKYDGSPVLKLHGCFMAGLATHLSSEPDTLVVRADFEERRRLIEDAPDTYYITGHYRAYPVVLARLSQLNPDALRDLLAASWRLTLQKARIRRPAPPT